MSKISSLSHQVFECEQEYRELENKYSEALKTIEKMKLNINEKCSKDITYKFKDLNGKTIERVIPIRGEYGRTYNTYLGFVCSDGSRVLLYGDSPYNPSPELKEMIDSTFYTDEEIKVKETYIINEKKHRETEVKRRKEEELRRLQNELNKSN